MGRVLCDAFYHCNYYLLKKAAKLKSITGCIVNLEITSTWEKGVKKIYHMKGHEIDFQSDKESEQSFFDTSTGNVTYETPKKWKQKKSMCPVCGKIRKVIPPFGLCAQEKYANARVL